MAGGSGSVGSLPPMGQTVSMSNNNLNNVGAVCSDQQVGLVIARQVSVPTPVLRDTANLFSGYFKLSPWPE